MTHEIRLAVSIVVMSLIVAGIHWFIFRRYVAPLGLPDKKRRALAWVLAGLGASFPLVRFASVWVSPEALLSLAGPVWLWSGYALYLLMFGVGVWMAQGVMAKTVPDLARRNVIKRATALGAAAASGGMGTWGFWNAFAEAEIVEVSVTLPRLPRALDGFTIVQLSDIHVGDVLQRRFLESLVSRANALKPDMVALTGDLVDGSVPRLGPIVAGLSNLRSRYGTFFVTGNHEYYSNEGPWVDALNGFGVQVLRNRRVTIGDAGASFDLVGVDDWHGASSGRGGYDLGAATAGRDLDRAAVLLAHQPAGFDDAARRGMGLQLSGHTHGGQMFPLTAFISLIHPRSRGLYASGDSRLYVNRGAGFWGPPMRLGSPPEITRLVLRA